jgi:hypothetical protein
MWKLAQMQKERERNAAGMKIEVPAIPGINQIGLEGCGGRRPRNFL